MNIDYFSDEPISDEELETIASLAHRQVELSSQVADLELMLDKTKKELYRLSTEILPQAMAEIGTGLSEIKLKNGARITIKKMYYASIKEENKARAFGWLRANNFEGLIKNEIKMTFGKGEDEIALKATELFRELKLPFDQKEMVHPQTLKAFVREMLEKGMNLPLDVFGAGAIDTAVVKLPEEK